MHNRVSIFTVCVLGSFLFLSCTRENSSPPSGDVSGLTVTLADSGQTHLLRDEMKPLSNVMMVEIAGDNALITVDAQPTVALFEDHEMIRTFGREGRGPCEFLDISNVDTSGDSLFVLDSPQTKIITYRISTGECLGETSHPRLQRSHYLERAGGAFLTGRIFYRSGTPDSTVLLSRVYEDERVENLRLTKRTVNPVPVLFPLSLPGLDFGRHGNRIYAAFPLSRIMAELDLMTGEISTFAMDLLLSREAFEEAMSQPGDAGELINGGMVEIVREVFAAENWIAVNTVRSNLDGPNIQTFHFYTPDGKHIRDMNVQGNPVALQDNRLLFLRTTDSTETQYGYQVTYRRVTVE